MTLCVKQPGARPCGEQNDEKVEQSGRARKQANGGKQGQAGSEFHLRLTHHRTAQHGRLQVGDGRHEVGRIVTARLAELRKLLLLRIAKRAALAVSGLPDHAAAVCHENLRTRDARFVDQQCCCSHVGRARSMEEENLLLQLVDEVGGAASRSAHADADGAEECGDRN